MHSTTTRRFIGAQLRAKTLFSLSPKENERIRFEEKCVEMSTNIHTYSYIYSFLFVYVFGLSLEKQIHKYLDTFVCLEFFGHV